MNPEVKTVKDARESNGNSGECMDVRRFKVLLKHLMKKQEALSRRNGGRERVALTPCIWGKHGIGKSSLIRQACADDGVGYIDLRPAVMEVGDLIGLPEKSGDRTVWLKPAWFPDPRTPERAAADAEAFEKSARGAGADPAYVALMARNIVESAKPRGIVAVEEVNRAQRDVRQALFQFVWDRRLHTHPLPDGWLVVCLANPTGHDYEVYDLDESFLDRLVHITLTPTKDDWVDFALKQEVDQRVVSFVQQYPHMLGNDILEVPLKRTPSPRAWFILNEMLADLPEDMIFEVAAGTVGKEAAAAFVRLLNQSDLPLGGNEVLNSYGKVRAAIHRWCDPAKMRQDLMKVTADNVLAELRRIQGEKNAELLPEQQRNLKSFIKDLPADFAFAVVKMCCRIEKAYEAMKDDKDLRDRMELALGGA